MDKASDGFTDYREMARNSNLSSNVQANMLRVRMNAKDYLITSSEKDQNEFDQYYKQTSDYLAKADIEIQKA